MTTNAVEELGQKFSSSPTILSVWIHSLHARPKNEFHCCQKAFQVALLQSAFPNCSQLTVELVPANITSRSQPMDARIIFSLRQQSRTLLYNKVLDAIDSNIDNLNIAQLTALRDMHSV